MNVCYSYRHKSAIFNKYVYVLFLTLVLPWVGRLIGWQSLKAEFCFLLLSHRFVTHRWCSKNMCSMNEWLDGGSLLLSCQRSSEEHHLKAGMETEWRVKEKMRMIWTQEVDGEVQGKELSEDPSDTVPWKSCLPPPIHPSRTNSDPTSSMKPSLTSPVFRSLLLPSPTTLRL